MQQDDKQTREWIRAAQNGDETAFAQLLTRLEAPVYRYALSLLHHEADAQDVTQEVFIKLWRTFPSYRFACPILSYVLTMTRNAAMDFQRRRAARGGWALSLTQTEEDGRVCVPDLPDPAVESSPPQIYEQKERMSAVYRAIEQLPQLQREVLVLRGLDGCSYEEIARILSVDVGTIKSRLFRARENLEKTLKEWNIL